MRYTIRADIIKQVVDQEAVLLDLKNNNIHHLNQTARMIWELCEEGFAVEEIADTLADNFSIDRSTALEDTITALRQWSEIGLVILGDIQE